MLSDDSTVPFVNNTKNDEAPLDPQINVKSSMLTILNLPFIKFIFGAVLSIACGLLYIMDHSIGFIISGIIGIIICTFGAKHFKTLINLKVEIDKFAKLNLQFRHEHNTIKQEVDRLSAANTTLSDTHNRLKISNQKYRDNLVVFRGIQYNMEQFNAQSMEELKDILDKVSSVERKWYEELFNQQRRLLHTVFDRFCSYQNHIGMTATEFEQFTQGLPSSYQDRFARMGTFKQLAGNKSIILLDDFVNCLDIFAEMQTCDVDIEFELQRTKTKRKLAPRLSLQQQKTHYFSNKDKSSILASICEYKMENNNVNMDEIDDRKYDNELLMYESQVVITKRSNTVKVVSPDSPLDLNLPALSQLSSPYDSSLSQWMETETLTERIYAFYGGRASPYYKANAFEHNERIIDRSLRNLAPPETPKTLATPKFEQMTTTDIAQRDFTNEQIDIYMKKI